MIRLQSDNSRNTKNQPALTQIILFAIFIGLSRFNHTIIESESEPGQWHSFALKNTCSREKGSE